MSTLGDVESLLVATGTAISCSRGIDKTDEFVIKRIAKATAKVMMLIPFILLRKLLLEKRVKIFICDKILRY